MAWLPAPASSPSVLFSSLALSSVIVTPVHPAATGAALTPAASVQAVVLPVQFAVRAALPASGSGPSQMGYTH